MPVATGSNTIANSTISNSSSTTAINSIETVIGASTGTSSAVLNIVAGTGNGIVIDQDGSYNLFRSTSSNNSGVLTFYSANVPAIVLNADPAHSSRFTSEVVFGGVASTAQVNIEPNILHRWLYLDVDGAHSGIYFDQSGNTGSQTFFNNNIGTVIINGTGTMGIGTVSPAVLPY